MTGFPLIIAFIVAIVFMIVAISKFKIHPFLSIMGVSLILGLVAGIPLVDQTASDGTVTSGLATVIGAGFSGTFTSIGIVIILGALIGRDRSCIETCRHGHPSGWKKPSRVGYGTDGMGCFHSGIL